MEEKEKMEECPGCKCDQCQCRGYCGHMHGQMNNCCWRHGGYRFWRWIIGILILVFVFTAGVKMGELKSYFYDSSTGVRSLGHRYMMYDGQNFVMGPEAMNLWNKLNQGPTSTAK